MSVRRAPRARVCASPQVKRPIREKRSRTFTKL